MKTRFSSLIPLVLYLFMVTVCSNAQNSEYLSISVDCGASSNYSDAALGINWVTDDAYISAGTNRRMEEGTGVDLPRHLYSFRYFPTWRSKNCYVLPVETGTTYLLRVTLFRGSARPPSIPLPVDFNVTLDSNHWFSYAATTDSDRDPVVQESVFHSFQKKEIYLCLLQGAKGAPFINSIELRRLVYSMYWRTRDAQDQPQFMVLGDRINMGTKSDDNSILRYPDDVFDRFWWPSVPTSLDIERVDRSLADLSFYALDPEDPPYGKYNWPPNKTLADAWVGRELSFGFGRERVDTNRVYGVFYFKEIRPGVSLTGLLDNGENITYSIGDKSLYQTIRTTREYYGALYAEVENDFIMFNVILVGELATETGNTTDAILNAFEYYYLYDVDISATYSTDKATLNALQESFALQDWTGDPCYPVAWDWITCDPDTSRVQKLNLTNMNISTSIPENISRLIELTELYLQNNHINGSIPNSMVSLTKLKILALDNNELIGEVPVEFQNRPGFTFTGNPGLRVQGNSSGDSISPAPAAPARSYSAKSSSKFDTFYVTVTYHVSGTWWP